MKMSPLLLLLPLLVGANQCNHATAFNGSVFDLKGCTTLDLSCPSDGVLTRSKDVCDNLLLPGEIAALASALEEGAPGLEVLSLRGSPLGAAGTATLAPAIASCEALHTLNLGSCRVGDVGARTLAQTLIQPGKPTTLRRIELPHNSVSDDGVRAIAAALAGGEGLAELDLSWNAIGTRGGRYLGDALKGTSGLAKLTLSWNGLMDRGARAIGEGLGGNGALTLLDVEHNAIKDEGAKALAKGLRTNGNLQTIRLDHNGISNATLLEVATALAAAPEARDVPAAEAPRQSGGGMQDEEIEEISFDDDVAAEAEAEAEADDDARARRSASCVDNGPWACEEAECPSPSLSCEDLAGLGVCALQFSEVWESQPADTKGKAIAELCPKACRKCDGE